MVKAVGIVQLSAGALKKVLTINLLKPSGAVDLCDDSVGLSLEVTHLTLSDSIKL